MHACRVPVAAAAGWIPALFSITRTHLCVVCYVVNRG